jgi:hypothetical protein
MPRINSLTIQHTHDHRELRTHNRSMHQAGDVASSAARKHCVASLDTIMVTAAVKLDQI